MSDLDVQARALELAEAIDWSSKHQEEFAQEIIKLAREAADARSRVTAKAIEQRERDHIRSHPSALFIQQGLAEAKEIVRSFMSRTRDNALEDALRLVILSTKAGDRYEVIENIARRALEES